MTINDSYNKQIEQLNDDIQHLLVGIKEKEIDLSDISLLDIIERFLEYIFRLQPSDIDLDITADFLVSISTLIFWKSNLLLPGLPEDTEEEFTDYDNDDSLKEEYWREYRKYQSLIGLFQEKAEEQSAIFLTNLKSKINSKEQYQENHFSSLIIALESILSKSKVQEPIKINKRKYNIIEKMKEIENKFKQNRANLTFQSLISHNCPKIEIIIIFLALLELICRGKVIYKQSQNFGDIIFFRKEDKKLKKQKINP